MTFKETGRNYNMLMVPSMAALLIAVSIKALNNSTAQSELLTKVVYATLAICLGCFIVIYPNMVKEYIHAFKAKRNIKKLKI